MYEFPPVAVFKHRVTHCYFIPTLKKKKDVCKLEVIKLLLIYISCPLVTQDIELRGKVTRVHHCHCCHPPE